MRHLHYLSLFVLEVGATDVLREAVLLEFAEIIAGLKGESLLCSALIEGDWGNYGFEHVVSGDVDIVADFVVAIVVLVGKGKSRHLKIIISLLIFS
jgi:hypothetical protein